MKKIGLLTLLVVFLTSCMSGVPVPDDKKDYVGVWQSDNVYLKITKDGHIDYTKEEGSKKTSISGPISKFENEDFFVSVLGVKTKFDIEKTPFINEKGQTAMVLEGNTLIKTNTSTIDNNVEMKKITLPSKYLINKLVENNIALFNESIKAGNFTKFYKKISKHWREQTNVKELNKIFKNLIENKETVLNSGKGEIVIRNTKLDENNNLIVEGYKKGNLVLHFKLTFINENGQWMLFGIDVSYKKF